MTDMEKTELLARERSRVAEPADPLNKTKSYILISDIMLDFAAGAALGGDTWETASLLEQYTTIMDARDTLINVDGNAAKDADGFREFEIALRNHARLLSDLNQSRSVAERPPVERTLSAATEIRAEILRLMFPEGSASLKDKSLINGHAFTSRQISFLNI
jgi:hypothetical protein